MKNEKPPLSGLRQRRREGNIEAFVDAALEVLVTDGYEAVTVAGVAKRMGCAPGAMYRYFAGKDELMVAAQRRVLDGVNDQLAHALARIDAHLTRARTLDKRQMALLRLMAVPLVHEWIAVERPAYFALLSLSVSTPTVLVPTDTAQPAMMSLMSLNHAIARLLDDAVHAGALRAGDAARRAVLLWASHQGVLQLRKLGRFGMPALPFDGLSVDLLVPLLSGWGAPSDEIAPLYDRARRLLAEHSPDS